MRLLVAGTFGVLLTACGGGGGGDGGNGPSTNPPVAPVPPAASFSLSYPDMGKQPAVGSFLHLELAGADAASVSLVTIDGKPAAFSVADGRLLLPTAALAAGQHTLTVGVGSEKVNSTFSLQATVLPTAPVPYIENFMRDLHASIGTRAAAATGPDQAYLLSLQAELAAQQASVRTMDEASARELALSLHANLGSAPAPAAAGPQRLASIMASNGSRGFDEAACESAKSLLTFSVITAAGSVPFLLIPHPAAKIIAAGVFVGATANAVAATNRAIRDCVVDGDSLTMVDVVTSAPKFTFELSHDVASKAWLRMKTKLSDKIPDGLIARVNALGATVASVRAQTRTALFAIPDNFGSTLDQFQREQTVPAEAVDYFIGNISDTRIEGEHNGTADVSEVRFRFRKGQMPQTVATFTFDLMRAPDNKVMATYSARLAPLPLPIASSQNLSASPGIALHGRLSGAYVGHYEITVQPTSGVLNMYNNVEGKFIYTVNSGVPVQTTDLFKFVAINEAGKSTEGTVSIKVDMLEAFKAAVVGNWVVINMESKTSYPLTVRADGTGTYVAESKNYPMSWKIAPNRNNEYAFYDGDFWHHGFYYLDRDGLTLPIKSFYTYGTDPVTGKPDRSKPALHYVRQ